MGNLGRKYINIFPTSVNYHTYHVYKYDIEYVEILTNQIVYVHYATQCPVYNFINLTLNARMCDSGVKIWYLD